LIKRGKQPEPIQYGHKVLVIEDAVGFICHYEVVANGVLDQDVLEPAMSALQKRVGGKIERASFDRAFHTPANQKKLAELLAPAEWYFVSIPFMHQMLITALSSIAIIAIISQIEGKGAANEKAIILTKDFFKTSPAFNIGAVIILIICTALYAIFW
jgi:hypothetical protein